MGNRSARRSLALLIAFMAAAMPAPADKGQILPIAAMLEETSQNAIAFYDGNEETLVLGTRFESDSPSWALEFIPFPSRPTVAAVEGDPFGAAQALATAKKIEFLAHSKGGDEPVGVDVLFSGSVGAHEVVVVEIGNEAGFAQWVDRYFQDRAARSPGSGVPGSGKPGAGTTAADQAKVRAARDRAVAVARDYISRGFRFFVFDSVELRRGATAVEPLAYRFASPRLYYPLRTSNVVGGDGGLSLVLFLPGTLGLLADGSDAAELNRLLGPFGYWELSSSSKVTAAEMAGVHPGVAAMAWGSGAYLQILQYRGSYAFPGDLWLDVAGIAPFAYKHVFAPFSFIQDLSPLDGPRLAEPYTDAELEDAAAAWRAGREKWLFDSLLVDELRLKKFVVDPTLK